MYTFSPRAVCVRAPRAQRLACRASLPPPTPSPQPPPSPRPMKRVNMNIMRFDAFAPELINARLAMLGCATGAAVKSITGASFTQQFETNFLAFVLATAAITVATIVPFSKGVDYRDKKSYTVEMMVGRLAMLGFALALVVDRFSSSLP